MTEPVLNELYDVKDSLHRWFEAKVIKIKDRKYIKVHFSGWASAFDEKICVDQIPARFAPHNTHVAKLDFAVGNEVEVYNNMLGRWRNAKVVEVDDDFTEAKVDWLESEWIKISRENFSEPGTHIRSASVVMQSSCPNGTKRALNIAGRLGDTNLPALAEMYEELALQSSLSRGNCLFLNQLLADIGLAYAVESKATYSGKIEERRYYEARAALAIERGFRSSSGSALTEPNSDSPFCAEVDQDTAAIGEVAAQPSTMGLSKSHIDILLKTWKRFRDLCEEDWAALTSEERAMLDLADTLELDACRSTTVATRRMLFAESAKYMEQCTRVIQKKNVRAACYWRICRHYILGLGIDITEFSSAKSSDLQAEEYLDLRQFGACEYFTFYKGMLQTLGRWAGSRHAVVHPFHHLAAAAEGGVPHATFWMASLLLEGWGTLEDSGMSSREEELIRTRSLFETCMSFNFLGDLCSRREQVVAVMLQNPDGKTKRFYALALHIFAVSLKEKLETSLSYLLFFLVTHLAKQRDLPGPVRDTPQWEVNSETIKGLRERAFPAISVFDMASPDDALEKAKQQSLRGNVAMLRRMNQLWIKQNFNNTFPFNATSSIPVSAPASAPPASASPYSASAIARVQRRVPRSVSTYRRANYRRATMPAPSVHASSTENVDDMFSVEGLVVAPSAYTTAPKRGWTADDCDALLNCVDDVRDLFVMLVAAVDGMLSPVLEVRKRLNVVFRSMPILKSFLDVHLPTTCIAVLWRESLNQAELTYDSIPPLKRFLSEQKHVYNDALAFTKSPVLVERAMKVCMTDSPESPVAWTKSHTAISVLRVVNMARELHAESGDAEDNVLEKHCASALAVIGYATKKGITNDAAMLELEQMGLPLLRQTPCSKAVASVGYHFITEAIRVHEFVSTLDTANILLDDRVQFLMDNPSFSLGWRGSGQERGGETKTLLEIFQNFKEFVEKEDRANLQLAQQSLDPRVTLDLHAMTFQDPWVHLGHIDVNSVLTDLPQSPRDLAAELNIPEIEVVEQMLKARIRDKFNTFENPAALSGLFDMLDKYKDTTSRVLLKKKMLFVLLNAPDVDWSPGSESLQLLFIRLMSGLQEFSRCPDGVSSFCDNFMQGYHYEQCQEALHTLPADVGRLIISVATFVFHWKRLFKRLHQSRLKSHYEGRTAGDVVLHDMLMLPLSLPGIYSQVRYPHFATQGHVDETALDSGAVCERFVKGGTIAYSYGHTVTVPPLTLRAVIDAFKSCIVKELTGITPPPPESRPDLEQLPRMDFTINEDIIMDFVKSDLAIGPFYEAAKQTGFTVDNAYFKPMNIGNENADQLTKPFAVQVLRDRAFVRILHVCKYVRVPEDFESKVSTNWELPDEDL